MKLADLRLTPRDAMVVLIVVAIMAASDYFRQPPKAVLSIGHTVEEWRTETTRTWEGTLALLTRVESKLDATFSAVQTLQCRDHVAAPEGNTAPQIEGP
jgi:hypothetical protein